MTLYPKLILDALATVRYPGTGKNLVEADMVADNIRIDGMSVSFSLTFEKPTIHTFLRMCKLRLAQKAVRLLALNPAKCFRK